MGCTCFTDDVEKKNEANFFREVNNDNTLQKIENEDSIINSNSLEDKIKKKEIHEKENLIKEKLKKDNLKNENLKKEISTKESDKKEKLKTGINEGKKKSEILSFDKELCKKIANSLPKRTATTFQSLKDLMKSKTEKLSQKEKSFIIFLWICDNIAYDSYSYYAGSSVDCSPEGVFKNGKTVCSGYAHLYKNFADYLDLDVECVTCYAKGVSYEPGQKMNESNHEYNVIKLNNQWYPIDSTWGAGHLKDKKFVKSYNEFYFLANPELLITTHFPVKDKWQLTKRKYTLEEFLKWPRVDSDFYRLGFEKYTPNEGLIELKNRNQQKFIIYGKDMDKKSALCSIYLLEGNIYQQQLNLTAINFYDDRFEVDGIFNQKGKYKVQIFANNDKGENHDMILEYNINVEKNSKEKLAFPMTYGGSEEVNIIEPLYDNLKSGEKVKFKIKSKLDEIIIIDGQWHHLKKNESGFFELETKIKTKKGNNLIIGKKKGTNSCGYLVSYNVI